MMRSKKWNDNQKDVILKFLRLHLKQQLTERLQLEKTKKLCKTNRGNVLYFYFDYKWLVLILLYC